LIAFGQWRIFVAAISSAQAAIPSCMTVQNPAPVASAQAIFEAAGMEMSVNAVAVRNRSIVASGDGAPI
jgi:hypothetical protein